MTCTRTPPPRRPFAFCTWCKNHLSHLFPSTRPIWVNTYTCEEWRETPKTPTPICTQVDFAFCFEVLILILYFRIYYYYLMVNSQELSDQLYTSVSKIVKKHGSTVDVSVIINAFISFTNKRLTVSETWWIRNSETWRYMFYKSTYIKRYKKKTQKILHKHI